MNKTDDFLYPERTEVTATLDSLRRLGETCTEAIAETTAAYATLRQAVLDLLASSLSGPMTCGFWTRTGRRRRWRRSGHWWEVSDDLPQTH